MTKVREAKISPPSRYNPSCSHDLDDVVLQALARHRDDRWPSAAAMRDALAQVRRAYRKGGTPRDVAAWVGDARARALAEEFDGPTDPTGSREIEIEVAELGPLEAMVLEREEISRQIYVGRVADSPTQPHTWPAEDVSKEIVIISNPRTRTSPGVSAPTRKRKP
jgi:hypothetical protein